MATCERHDAPGQYVVGPGPGPWNCGWCASIAQENERRRERNAAIGQRNEYKARAEAAEKQIAKLEAALECCRLDLGLKHASREAAQDRMAKMKTAMGDAELDALAR